MCLCMHMHVCAHVCARVCVGYHYTNCITKSHTGSIWLKPIDSTCLSYFKGGKKTPKPSQKTKQKTKQKTTSYKPVLIISKYRVKTWCMKLTLLLTQINSFTHQHFCDTVKYISSSVNGGLTVCELLHQVLFSAYICSALSWHLLDD